MENDMGEEEPESEESEDEGEKPIYNPKKVPLDWTGKPIPYWLYKLHGLNIESDALPLSILPSIHRSAHPSF